MYQASLIKEEKNSRRKALMEMEMETAPGNAKL